MDDFNKRFNKVLKGRGATRQGLTCSPWRVAPGIRERAAWRLARSAPSAIRRTLNGYNKESVENAPGTHSFDSGPTNGRNITRIARRSKLPAASLHANVTDIGTIPIHSTEIGINLIEGDIVFIPTGKKGPNAAQNVLDKRGSPMEYFSCERNKIKILLRSKCRYDTISI